RIQKRPQLCLMA
ncbi:cystathionine beta-lyase, partial [Vibrio parahaemolyticus VP2007-007]